MMDDQVIDLLKRQFEPRVVKHELHNNGTITITFWLNGMYYTLGQVPADFPMVSDDETLILTVSSPEGDALRRRLNTLTQDRQVQDLPPPQQLEAKLMSELLRGRKLVFADCLDEYLCSQQLCDAEPTDAPYYEALKMLVEIWLRLKAEADGPWVDLPR